MKALRITGFVVFSIVLVGSVILECITGANAWLAGVIIGCIGLQTMIHNQMVNRILDRLPKTR